MKTQQHIPLALALMSSEHQLPELSAIAGHTLGFLGPVGLQGACPNQMNPGQRVKGT